MQLESKKLLRDVLQALDLLSQFAKGKTFPEFESDAMLRAAVERQFEIIGEALKKLADRDPESAEQIPEFRRIISFRNVLIHGYADVDIHVVWEALTTRVAPLRGAVRSLLG